MRCLASVCRDSDQVRERSAGGAVLSGGGDDAAVAWWSSNSPSRVAAVREGWVTIDAGRGPRQSGEPSLAVVPPVGGRLPGAGRSSDSRARIGRSTYCPSLPRLFGPVLDDGGRSRLPLRGSPGVSPGSLLPLHRRDGGEPVAGPTLRQRDSTTRSTGVSRRGAHDPERTCYAR